MSIFAMFNSIAFIKKSIYSYGGYGVKPLNLLNTFVFVPFFPMKVCVYTRRIFIPDSHYFVNKLIITIK